MLCSNILLYYDHTCVLDANKEKKPGIGGKKLTLPFVCTLLFGVVFAIHFGC